MKEYGDEGFIQMIKDGQVTAQKDIRKGSVLVGGKTLVFKEREILKRKMWIWMPDSFGQLSKELARLKYPNENRPDIIFTNPETTVNVTVSHKQDKLGKGQEEEIRDYMEQVIARLHPESGTIEKQTALAGEHCFAWFDFVTPAIDTEIYNLMFFTALENRLLMGACNCLKPDMEEWKELFIQMLESVRFA